MNVKTYLTGLTVIAAISLSCCGQKKVSEEKVTPATVETKSTFDSTGYTEGTIVQTKEEGDCEWVIKLKDGRLFETTKMDASFKEDGTKVWIKYTPQRRMQRCDKASPVAIDEMLVRE